MEKEVERMAENFKNKSVKTNQPERVFENYILNVEFSKSQSFFTILFTAGLVFFGLYVLILSLKVPFGLNFIITALGILLVLFGIALPLLVRRDRRKMPRSFSARGIELWNGKMMPWTQVNAIGSGSQIANGISFKKLNIAFGDGSSVYVSKYNNANFDEIDAYLAEMPQYC